MTTYSWQITGVKTKDIGDKKDVICSISFRKTGIDRFNRTGIFVGTIPVDTSNISDTDYVEFNKLIQEDIIKWLEQIITPEFEKHINDSIEEQILSSNDFVEKTIPMVIEEPEFEEEIVEEVILVKKTKPKVK